MIQFGQDFTSSVPFAYLLKSHVPEYVSKTLSLFNYSPTSYDDKVKNAELILTCFNELFGKQTSLDVSADVIANGNQVINSLITAFLYQTLPQFLNSSEIVFEGSLYEHIKKHIELLNNSNTAISYTPVLTGAPEFTLDLSDTITVGAKSQVQLPVEFVGRHSKSSQAQLVLKSTKMMINTTSILIFKLKSVLSAATPIKKYLAESPLYTGQMVNVEIKNPFNLKGKFDIKLTQCLVCHFLIL